MSGGKPSTPVIKKEAAIDAIVTLDIAGNEYNSAYLHSNHVRRSPIKIPVAVQNTEASALVDTGATINAISEALVEENKIPTTPCPPIQIKQTLHNKASTATQKVKSKVSIPSKEWTSQSSHSLIVAPFNTHDIILEMPFLVDEKAKINLDRGTLTLQSTKPDILTKSPNLTSSSPVDIRIKHMTHTEWKPTIDSDEASKLSQYMLNEYADVFADKLPNKPPHPKAPLHRIRLKDESKSTNGHAYRIPGMYLNKMLNFIEEQLAAGRI